MVAIVWVEEEDDGAGAKEDEGDVAGPSRPAVPAAYFEGRAYHERRAGLERRRYFWRRLLAVWVVAVLAALTWNATQRLFSSAEAATAGGPGCGYAAGQSQTIALASAGGTALRAAAPLPELGFNDKATSSCSHVYVARPGDTIWQIAVRYSGGGDPRPLADRLEAEIGGGTLQPGQTLNVP